MTDRGADGDGAAAPEPAADEVTDDAAAAGPSKRAADEADGGATDSTEPAVDEADGADEADAATGAAARDMTVNVGIVTALVLTPLVWLVLEGLLTVANHHPGTWGLRLATVGGANLLFWTALGVDESRDDDWVGLAAIGWLLVLLPLWLLTEAAVVALDLAALAGVGQTYLRLAISGLSAVLFGVLLDRRRGG